MNDITIYIRAAMPLDTLDETPLIVKARTKCIQPVCDIVEEEDYAMYTTQKFVIVSIESAEIEDVFYTECRFLDKAVYCVGDEVEECNYCFPSRMVACSVLVRKNGLHRLWHPNGRISEQFTMNDGKKEGIYRAWNENGGLVELVEYENGEYHGEYKFFHENGTCTQKTYFMRGVEHGERRDWSPSGRLVAKATLKNGKFFGRLEEWHENGRKARVQTYVEHEQLHGRSIAWDKYGNVTTLDFYEYGQPILLERWVSTNETDA